MAVNMAATNSLFVLVMVSRETSLELIRWPNLTYVKIREEMPFYNDHLECDIGN